MAEDSAAVVDATLLDRTVPLVEGLDARLRAGVDVADIGCGSGHAINVLARAYPASGFTGFDFSEEAIAAGRAEAAAWGLSNATFELCDVATLDRRNVFDVITAFRRDPRSSTPGAGAGRDLPGAATWWHLPYGRHPRGQRG